MVAVLIFHAYPWRIDSRSVLQSLGEFKPEERIASQSYVPIMAIGCTCKPATQFTDTKIEIWLRFKNRRYFHQAEDRVLVFDLAEQSSGVLEQPLELEAESSLAWNQKPLSMSSEEQIMHRSVVKSHYSREVNDTINSRKQAWTVTKVTFPYPNTEIKLKKKRHSSDPLSGWST